MFKVRECAPDELAMVEPVASVLGQAFAADPWMSYVFESAASGELIARLFKPMVRAGLTHGKVFITEPELDGAAVSMAPGKWDLAGQDLADAGFDDLPEAIGPRPLARFERHAAETHAAHERLMTSRHWYLALLGVAASCRRQGIGKALLSPLLHLADADHLPIYLETSQRMNLHFYSELGFHAVHQGSAPDGDGRYWSMTRRGHQPA